LRVRLLAPIYFVKVLFFFNLHHQPSQWLHCCFFANKSDVRAAVTLKLTKSVSKFKCLLQVGMQMVGSQAMTHTSSVEYWQSSYLLWLLGWATQPVFFFLVFLATPYLIPKVSLKPQAKKLCPH